jgi:hypothetical protein
VNLLCDNVRIREDAGADNAAHHYHRRVEQTETASEIGFGWCSSI